MPPGPIEPTRVLSFTSGPHTLYGEYFAAAGSPSGVVVMVHGYAEHCGRYREVAAVLTGAGFAVVGFDVRGHGRSTGRRGHVDRFAEYLDDLDAAIGQARALVGPDLPLVLMAHSNGSLITLRALAEPTRRPAVRAAIVSSPFLGLRLKVPGLKIAMARVASRIAPRLTLPNALKVEDLTSDEGKQAERRADTLCHEVATARWFTEASAAQAYVAAHPQFGVPTTWLIGGADPIADPTVSRTVAAAASPPAQIHFLDGLRHEVFNERERDRVFALLVAALPR
jgi:lysophospholipase